MEFIKKHWVKIVIGLLIIFGLNKCTVACNRDTKINKQAAQIEHMDSVIKVQSDSLNILRIRWNDAQTNQSTYQGIALDTKQELLQQVNDLTDMNKKLTLRISTLSEENTKLKRENNQLKQQINNQ